jgi:hypothetical protein
MNTHRAIALALAVLLVGSSFASAAPKEVSAESPAALQLYRDLPADPLAVFAVSVDDLAAKLEGAIGWLDRTGQSISQPGLGGQLEQLESRLGLSLRSELLPHIGPEVSVALDIPPIDLVVTALQTAQADALSAVLGQSGLVAAVRDAKRLDAALRKLLTGLNASAIDEEGMVRVDLPMAGVPGRTAASFTFYYAIERDRMAAGFSRDWVQVALTKRKKDRRLESGQDFARVFGRLDERPHSLTYVNLPRLRDLIANSQIVQAVLQGSQEARELLMPLLDTEVMEVGVGSTSIVLDDGVRTTYFGPHWMSGAAVSGGLLAALTVPNLLTAADSGRSRRTEDEIRSIADACEGFSSDTRSYPGPTEGYVPVETVSAFLEPIYIGSLPRVDAWDNPILYWSDGDSYRIISTGHDGAMDQDWSVIDTAPTARHDGGDIVYGDGRLLTVPSP